MLSTPVRGLPLGHRQHPRRPLRQLRATGSLLEAGARLHAGRNGGPAPHSGRKKAIWKRRFCPVSWRGASTRAALCAAGDKAFALYRSRREARVHSEAMRTALTEQYSAVADALGVLSEQLGRPGSPEPYKSGRGVGAVRSAGDAAAGMRCNAGRFGPHPGGGDAAPRPASMKKSWPLWPGRWGVSAPQP